MKINDLSPILSCKNVTQSIAFYKNAFNCDILFEWEDPATYALIGIGERCFHISQEEQVNHISKLYIDCDDVDAIYQKCIDEKVSLLSEVVKQPWNRLEFECSDLDGNIFIFAETISDS